MRVAFIGCVEFSFAALERILELREPELVGVVTRSASPFNADFRSLESLAAKAGVPCLFARGNDKAAMADWLRARRPEVIYCFGWSSLLGAGILSRSPLGVVGYHPAALPQNRGRHPIIWALALGLTETASTFFFMDDGADSGDILSQVKIPILPSDDAGALYGRLTQVALGQIEEFTPQLASGRYPRVPQDHTAANTWRKRNKEDGRIDWRMSADSVHNLVRALTRPYVGAHCVHRGKDIRLWKTALIRGNAPPNAEPGKVMATEGSTIVVRCGEGAVELLEHEFERIPAAGSYL